MNWIGLRCLNRINDLLCNASDFERIAPRVSLYMLDTADKIERAWHARDLLALVELDIIREDELPRAVLDTAPVDRRFGPLAALTVAVVLVACGGSAAP